MTPLPTTNTLTRPARQRALGALLGSAVADALGAPFEFGPAGEYRTRFPDPVVGGTGEMTGGGSFGWAPGEFTDDTQMALALAESIIANRAIDPDDLWARWRVWARTARDVGVITGSALGNDQHAGAAEHAHRRLGRSAGNGALMRVTPVGIAGAAIAGDESPHLTVRAAITQAALTHHDPAAGWGAAIAAELVRRAVHGADPIAEIDDVLTLLPADQAARFGALLGADWTPHRPGDPGNGTVWTCLAQAVWALRHHDTFHDVVTAVIDLGGDTDTVACVAGAIAGARHGVQGIPTRWLTYVHGTVTGPDGEVRYDNEALQRIARRLVGASVGADSPPETAAPAQHISHEIHAADLLGATAAAAADPDWAVLSLCRTGSAFTGVPVRRQCYLIDEPGDHNADLFSVVSDAVDTIDAWLAEGRRVLVHCHGGRSRTTLVLKAWAMRRLGLDADQAHTWIDERWYRYDPWNRAFSSFLVHDWTNHLHGIPAGH